MDKMSFPFENHLDGNRIKGVNSTPGWRVFDLEQRRIRQGLVSDHSFEDFPALSGPYPAESLVEKQTAGLEKTYSSVLGGPELSPSKMDAQNCSLQRCEGEPAANSCVSIAQNADTSLKLNDLHPWADESLIQDVLAAVNNNVDEAVCLLGAMLNSNNHAGKMGMSNGSDLVCFDAQGGISAGEKIGIGLISQGTLDGSYKEPNVGHSAESTSIAEREPEWGEDDLYLLNRKNAIKHIRYASRLSKASNEAYAKGDHISARHFSVKAQEQWNISKKLNAKAASEIFRIRNSENDLYRLDLHGLHAGEAIVALRERLQTVETLVSRDCLDASNAASNESRTLPSTLVPSIDHIKLTSLEGQHRSSRQRLMSLHVITGKGNHSQGAAALPSTVKSFLTENGYHFDERPGMIVVRLKFRTHCQALVVGPS